MEILEIKCIDGGTCHHMCKDKCFRRECCSPFSDYEGEWAYPLEHRMQPKFDHIRKAVEQYTEFQSETNVMENGEFRWDYYKVQRKIVAAANWYNGYILIGARHWDALMQMQANAVGGSKLLRDWAEGEEIQGFVDQYRNFLTREEAAKIAIEAGQIEKLKFCNDELFSEDLY